MPGAGACPGEKGFCRPALFPKRALCPWVSRAGGRFGVGRLDDTARLVFLQKRKFLPIGAWMGEGHGAFSRMGGHTGSFYVKGHGRKRETYNEWLKRIEEEQKKALTTYEKPVEKSAESSIIKPKEEAQKPSIPPSSETVTVDSEAVYKAAKAGTRHAGVYRDAANKSKPRLLKSIKSHEEQVRLHADKIAHPEKYDAGWSSKSEQEKDGLLRKWRKDMQRNAEQAAIEKETLKERFGDES